MAFFATRRRRITGKWKQGVEAFERGDMEVAVKAFRACLRNAPTWVPARRLLGRALAAAHRIDEAEQELRLAAKLEPRNPEGHLDFAIFLARYAPDRADEAIDSLAEAVEHGPRLREQLAAIEPLAPLRDHPRFQALLSPPPLH
jgi:Flp pilus assembly protein TadD